MMKRQHSLSDPVVVDPVAAELASVESVLVAVDVAVEADLADGVLAVESVLVAGMAVESYPVAGVVAEADLVVVVAAAAPAVVPIEELQKQKNIPLSISFKKSDIAFKNHWLLICHSH